LLVQRVIHTVSSAQLWSPSEAGGQFPLARAFTLFCAEIFDLVRNN
jgi:hypothetical protein